MEGAMTRTRVEAVLAAVLAVAALATLVWPTWIENLTGFEPDGGTGETEWWLVAVLAVAAVCSAALSFRDLRSRHADQVPLQ
jgi:hypothetical protein